MTPRMKEELIKSIKEFFIANGAVEDAWGNYKFRARGYDMRAKILENVVRFEKQVSWSLDNGKTEKEWRNIFNKPIYIKDISISNDKCSLLKETKVIVKLK